MTVVGGGGLAAGILIGMERSGWSGTVPLLTMETEGADCFNAAIQKKEIVKLEAINSVATSLGICYLGHIYIQTQPAHRLLVLNNCWWNASLQVLLQPKPKIMAFKNHLIVLTFWPISKCWTAWSQKNKKSFPERPLSKYATAPVHHSCWGMPQR